MRLSDKIISQGSRALVWGSIHGVRFSMNMSMLAATSLLMGGYGFDGMHRFYCDWTSRVSQENLLNQLMAKMKVDFQQDIMPEDIKNIQKVIKRQKKIARNLPKEHYKKLLELEQENYATLARELKMNMEQFDQYLLQYHLISSLGLSTGITLNMLHVILAFGIAPLGSAIIFAFAALDQIKNWIIDIKKYLAILDKCETKLEYLSGLKFSKRYQHQINFQLIQKGMPPIGEAEDIDVYLAKQITRINQTLHDATKKIILNSFWYSFMLASISTLFLCANPLIGIGIFASGLTVYVAATKTPVFYQFKKMIASVREFCETSIMPIPARLAL